MRVHRLISILLLVEGRGKIKARELASKLETSVRTIYRDIDTLCEAGIPLMTTRGPDGGVQLMDGYSVDMDDLQGEDIISLYLSGMGIQPSSQSDMGIKLRNALLRLEGNLPLDYSKDISMAKKKFHFDQRSWWKKDHPIPCIDQLIKSVWETKRLKIVYKKIQGDLSIRTIEPYGIVVKRMDWYLIGYCQERRGIRTFKCQRIIKAQILEGGFSIPEGFTVEGYWHKSQERFKETCGEDEQYPVHIKLHRDCEDILKKTAIVHKEYDGDYIIAEINMYSYEHACKEVFNIIRYAEILKPEALRNVVREELKRLRKVYQEV